MDSLNREILKLSIPTIVSNVTIPLLGICDTAISGHLGSELFLSAIAVGTVMLNVVFWIFGFLRGGTTGLTANALGAGDAKEIAIVFYRGLLVAFGAGVVLIIFCVPAFQALWLITGGNDEIKGMVRDYFIIRVWGSPALLAVIMISGWFVGMQNTFFPMVIAISTNVINMAVSYMLAFKLEYGFIGVAYGTAFANWTGLFISCVCVMIFLKGKILKCRLNEIFRGKWLHYFIVNGNLFLRSLFIICVTMGVTAAGARIGNLTLAVNIIVMQFFQFFSFFIDGFAYSGEAMVGLRAGKKDVHSLNNCVRRLLIWTIGTALIFSSLYLFGAEAFASLMTENMTVVEGVTELNIWIALIPIVSCWAFIYDGFYIGVTDTFRMMISTLLSSIVFFIMIAFSFHGWVDAETFDPNRLIWTAFLSYLLIRGIYLAALWPKTVRNFIVH